MRQKPSTLFFAIADDRTVSRGAWRYGSHALQAANAVVLREFTHCTLNRGPVLVVRRNVRQDYRAPQRSALIPRQPMRLPNRPGLFHWHVRITKIGSWLLVLSHRVRRVLGLRRRIRFVFPSIAMPRHEILVWWTAKRDRTVPFLPLNFTPRGDCCFAIVRVLFTSCNKK